MSNEEHNIPTDAQTSDEQVSEENLQAEAAAGEGAEALLAKVAELEAQLQEAKENALRAAAEAQNVRRRAEQDVEKAHKFAVEKFAGDLLPVADNLERAVATFEGADESTKPLLEGVELTLKTLVDALSRHNLEAVDPRGEPFDPQLHQAMSMVPNPDVEPNTVIDVFQKGYTLNGRLVRPAMVVVSKSPA
ncbi:nucleotide exchange factor GrpE [Halioxenophilus sp. WMMB6]|uniref:nucleotide exchange factor GrpE n=1 Tax=Halioxenophilus sp. WMMB6 TaxID=3073815 RepID=UPI00295EE5F7|nr:nucleotide exchange factor GrpE [Halioxenophilus sp. WMMB6]